MMIYHIHDSRFGIRRYERKPYQLKFQEGSCEEKPISFVNTDPSAVPASVDLPQTRLSGHNHQQMYIVWRFFRETFTRASQCTFNIIMASLYFATQAAYVGHTTCVQSNKNGTHSERPSNLQQDRAQSFAVFPDIVWLVDPELIACFSGYRTFISARYLLKRRSPR